MGSNTIGAVGVGLPAPQNLFPLITNIPSQSATNRISLPPGGDFLIPSGTFAISTGLFSKIQVLDPVTNTWGPFPTTQQNGSFVKINADGVNFRIWNPTGFPIGAIVNANGTGFTSAPAVSASGTQGSTWLAIVGGGISQLNATVSGAGYAVAPLIQIAAPASPGVPATAVCTINSAGGIVTFTMVNNGAGYIPTSPPLVTIVPQQSDLNVGPAATTPQALTVAKATAQTSFVGGITAILLTNEGNNVQSSVPGLTLTGGGGSAATATALMDLSVTAIGLTNAGSSYTASSVVQILSIGGWVTSGVATANSPSLTTQLMLPRQLVAQTSTSPSGGVNTGFQILDGGEYLQPPTLYANPVGTSGGGNLTPAVFTTTMGGQNDTVFVTPI